MGRSDTRPFGPEIITGFVAEFPPGTRFVIAFSGGADSLALLHAFARSREHDSGLRLCAVHVDHHLHPESTRWARQCMGVCGRLSVDLTGAGRVSEDERRRARRRRDGARRPLRGVRAHPLGAGRPVHRSLGRRPRRDRPAEPVARSRSKRSGGYPGPTAPRRRALSQGRCAASRGRRCMTYARTTALPLIRDPANDDLRYSRVVLRRKVIPVLESRWPGMRSDGGARRATRSGSRHELLDALAAIDLESAGGIRGASLDVEAVGALAPARRRNAIAGWLRANGIAPPGARRIEQIAREVVEARSGFDAVRQSRRHRGPSFPGANSAGRAGASSSPHGSCAAAGFPRNARAGPRKSRLGVLPRRRARRRDSTRRGHGPIPRRRRASGCARWGCGDIRSRSAFSRWAFRRGNVDVFRWCTSGDTSSPRSARSGSIRGSRRRGAVLAGGSCGLLDPDRPARRARRFLRVIRRESARWRRAEAAAHRIDGNLAVHEQANRVLAPSGAG